MLPYVKNVLQSSHVKETLLTVNVFNAIMCSVYEQKWKLVRGFDVDINTNTSRGEAWGGGRWGGKKEKHDGCLHRLSAWSQKILFVKNKNCLSNIKTSQDWGRLPHAVYLDVWKPTWMKANAPVVSLWSKIKTTICFEDLSNIYVFCGQTSWEPQRQKDNLQSTQSHLLTTFTSTVYSWFLDETTVC